MHRPGAQGFGPMALSRKKGVIDAVCVDAFWVATCLWAPDSPARRAITVLMIGDKLL